MTLWASTLIRAALFIPAFAFLGFGAVFLQDGIAQNDAFPVPIYIALNATSLRAAYSDAAAALRRTNPGTGLQKYISRRRKLEQVSPEPKLSKIFQKAWRTRQPPLEAGPCLPNSSIPGTIGVRAKR